jgi:hypothetical protein
LKAANPIVVTLSGIVTDVKPVAPLKARSPIAVTPSSITAEPEQPEELVTMLPVIMKVPPPEQATGPSATAEAGALRGRDRGMDIAAARAMDIPMIEGVRMLPR